MTDEIPARLRRTSADQAAEALYRTATAGGTCYATDAYRSYVAWASESGLEVVSTFKWEKAVIQAGLLPRVLKGRKVWFKSPEYKLISLADDLAREKNDIPAGQTFVSPDTN
jgi:hypothetical protein